MRVFHLFSVKENLQNATKTGKMFNCIIFYNSIKIYLQFPPFPDKFVVKSKMAAILVVILDDVTVPPAVP